MSDCIRWDLQKKQMEFAKKAKIKIKFKKMNGSFLDSIPWLKSPQPPLIYHIYNIY